MYDIQAPAVTPGRHSLPSQAPHRRLWWGVAAAVVAIAVAAAVLILTRNDATSTFTAHGSVAVEGATIYGSVCNTSSSIDFSDVDTGVAVKISNPNGSGIGTAVLGVGRYDQADQLCVFSWSTRLPANLSSYSVTISHRGTLVYTQADLAAGVRSSLTSGD